MSGLPEPGPLASLAGIALVVRHLALSGALCPTCGHGTRVTSKRWATCKQCGARVQRRTPAEVDREMNAPTLPAAATAALLAARGET